MMLGRTGHLLILLPVSWCKVQAWSTPSAFAKSTRAADSIETASPTATTSPPSRRDCLWTMGTAVVAAATSVSVSPEAAHAVRAVGSGELECRAAGNCLEKGELDGALGWNWGARDRCDALTDPTCGAGGKRRENFQDVALPSTDLNAHPLTHKVQIQLDIGREETGVLEVGLFGQDEPELVAQVVEFVSSSGILTSGKSYNPNALSVAALQAPVQLGPGTSYVTWIVPEESIELGVPSQASAFAKNRGTIKGLDDFVPQARPTKLTKNTAPSLSHNTAGFLSVPKQGLGYGGTGYENDDACFERTLLFTASSSGAKEWDKNRRVVGQILSGGDYLQRLANLPTQRGIRGVLPGQTAGPPLRKVVVRDVLVVALEPKEAASAGSEA